MYLDDPALIDLDLDTFHRSGSADNYSVEELAWLNAQCAGKITMVDHWLDKVLDTMDRKDLWSDTMLILTSDHGEFIGEYGQVSKGSGFSYPLLSRIPLIVAHPECTGGTTNDSLTCTVDIHATVLDALGLPIHESAHGHSILPSLLHDKMVRDDVLYGWWGKGFYWTDGTWLICKAPEQPGPLYQYGTNLGEKYVGLRGSYFDRYAEAETGSFMPHTDRPVYRVPSNGLAYANPNADFNALFCLQDDPSCDTDLWSTAQQDRDRCMNRLVGAMQAIDAPVEHFERLGLVKMA